MSNELPPEPERWALIDGGDYTSPRPICWVRHHGMLCDRRHGHLGDHVDIYGPLSGHTWPQTEQAS